MQRKSEGSPFYRRIMADAWRITWNHKHLWVFGFFTALTGFGSVSEVFFNASRRVGEWFPLLAAGKSPLYLIPGLTTMKAIISFSASPVAALVIFLVVFGLLSVVFLWMTMTSVGALVSSARKIEKGGEPTFSEGMRVGADRFWTILGINLLARLVIFCGIILSGATLYTLMQDRTVASGLFYVGSFVVFMIIALCASVIAVYATNYAVQKKDGVEKSISAGWRLLTEHWLVSIEMSILLFFVGITFGLTALLGAVVLSVPVIFLLMLSALLKTSAIASAVLVVAGTGFVLIIICAASFVAAFQTVSWTLLWGEIAERKPVSKLLRLAQRVGRR
jgi:hypothetical protein